MELSVHAGNGRKAEEKEEVIKDGHFGTRMMERRKRRRRTLCFDRQTKNF
jgi:hypothetical protein